MVTTRVTVRGNYVHHNRATGLATDWDNVHTLYEGNRVEDNLGVGIFHEASYDAVIRNNVVRRNGSATRGGFDGAGIGLNESMNVEIVGNTIVGNLHGVGIVGANREPGKYGAHVTRNVFVHDNTISLDERISSTGLASSDPADYTINNNRFEGNRYTYCQPTPFAWGDPDGSGYVFLTKEAWTALGHDTAGSFRIRSGC
jgi:parallel beta-helix repeat protein